MSRRTATIGGRYIVVHQCLPADRFDLVLNVREPTIGAIGNGSADDTDALQSAIDSALQNTNPAEGVARIYLPPGTYNISAALEIPFCIGFELCGAGRLQSKIVQTTANTPILSFAADPYSHHLHIHDLFLGYETQQTASDTSSACILIGGDANAQPFSWLFERIYFQKGFRGIYATATGNSIPWGVKVADCTFQHFTGSAIRSTEVAGKPNWRLDNLYIFNTGSGPTATEQAINLCSVTELVIHNLDIEGWGYQHLYIIGHEVPVLLDGYHMENSTWTGTGENYINYIGDGGFIARGVSVAGTVNKSSGDTYIFKGDGNTSALCQIEGMNGGLTLTQGNAYPLQLDNGALGFVSGVLDGTYTDNPINTAHAASLTGLRQSDGYTFLPTKAGVPTDADVPVAKDGAQVVDTTNHRLYVRDGGSWRYATLT